MAIKKRCIRCMKVLRTDDTCQNPSCSRYTPETEKTPEQVTDNNKENTANP